MELEVKRGCVYFFRHVGLSPIKIGYSKDISPVNRFNQFKTYAPFGSEIIGFIIISDARELESQLHKKYSSKRLVGEWFDITEDEVNAEIDFYTNISLIKERNDFQIEWAKKLLESKKDISEDAKIIKGLGTRFDNFKKMYLENSIKNRDEVSSKLGISKRTIIRWIKKIENDN